MDGTRFARLSDLFALVKKSGNATVRFNIETKVTPTEPDETLAPGPFAQKLIEVIRGDGMAARSTIQSFDWRTLKVVHETAPDIPTVCLTAQQKFLDNIAAGKPEGSPWTAGIQARDHGGSVPRMARAAHCKVWSPYFGDVTASQVKEAQDLGLTVVVWTVNVLLALGGAFLLYQSADKAKQAVLADLSRQLLQTWGRGKDQEFRAKQIQQITEEVESNRQGAFVPLYQQPVIESSLYGAVALLQYLYLG